MVIPRDEFSNHKINIEPFEACPGEYIVQDLHVAEEYHIPGDGRSDPSKIEGSFTLNPGHSIVIYTRERINIQAGDVFGQLCSKASLAAQGIMVANTKVDPWYNDHLRVPLYNASDQPFKVTPGKAFCSIYFMSLQTPISSIQAKLAPKWPAQQRRTGFDWASRNKMEIVTIVAALISLLGAILTIYFAHR